MIETKHLFPILDQKLIELLRSLDESDWNRQTVARLWKVRDVAAHLLDGNIRMLSLRDGYLLPPDREINSYSDLVAFLNDLNGDFVKASKRMSGRVLTDLLETTGKEYAAYIQTLAPWDQAIFAVSWAGEEKSYNWFHIAREFTEKWHHQQQIRDAVGKPGIMDQTLFHPFIATLLRGLPHAYRNVDAPSGTVVAIEITSEAGGIWYLVKGAESWTLEETETGHVPEARVCIAPDTAWKLFTKAVRPADAPAGIELTGNLSLGAQTLEMVAVMA